MLSRRDLIQRAHQTGQNATPGAPSSLARQARTSTQGQPNEHT